MFLRAFSNCYRSVNNHMIRMFYLRSVMDLYDQIDRPFYGLFFLISSVNREFVKGKTENQNI